jgi:TolA-binding protein
MQDHESALHRLAMHIQRNPNAPECVYLRKLLWSLYDPHYCINHYRLYTRTDRTRLPLVNDITTAASRQVLQKADLSRALLVAGEFARAPDIKISPEVIQWSDEAKCTIKEADERISQANELIEQANEQIRQAQEKVRKANELVEQAHGCIGHAHCQIGQSIAVLPPCPTLAKLGQISFSLEEAKVEMATNALFPNDCAF